jgi:hypothetical protein
VETSGGDGGGRGGESSGLNRFLLLVSQIYTVFVQLTHSIHTHLTHSLSFSPAPAAQFIHTHTHTHTQ